jgi:hypothetical protein
MKRENILKHSIHILYTFLHLESPSPPAAIASMLIASSPPLVVPASTWHPSRGPDVLLQVARHSPVLAALLLSCLLLHRPLRLQPRPLLPHLLLLCPHPGVDFPLHQFHPMCHLVICQGEWMDLVLPPSKPCLQLHQVDIRIHDLALASSSAM